MSAPLAIGVAGMQEATVRHTAPGQGQQHYPHQQGAAQQAGIVAEEPTDALARQQRAYRVCRERRTVEPRHQQQQQLGQEQREGNMWQIALHSASGMRLSMSSRWSSRARTTRRVALTLSPEGNSFLTSSFWRFSRLLTPKGMPRRPVICSLV